jgi:hypothetical protein
MKVGRRQQGVVIERSEGSRFFWFDEKKCLVK